MFLIAIGLYYSVKQFIHSSETDKNVYSLQRYLGSPSISVENREFYSYSPQFELWSSMWTRRKKPEKRLRRDRDVRDRDYNPSICPRAMLCAGVKRCRSFRLSVRLSRSGFASKRLKLHQSALPDIATTLVIQLDWSTLLSSETTTCYTYQTLGT